MNYYFGTLYSYQEYRGTNHNNTRKHPTEISTGVKSRVSANCKTNPLNMKSKYTDLLDLEATDFQVNFRQYLQFTFMSI